jgi:hypothetical protein
MMADKKIQTVVSGQFELGAVTTGNGLSRSSALKSIAYTVKSGPAPKSSGKGAEVRGPTGPISSKR